MIIYSISTAPDLTALAQRARVYFIRVEILCIIYTRVCEHEKVTVDDLSLKWPRARVAGVYYTGRTYKFRILETIRTTKINHLVRLLLQSFFSGCLSF